MPAKKKTKSGAASASLTFNHAMVYVRELAPALHFYADLLGFKVLEQVPLCYARLRSPRGQTTIALHKLEPGRTLPETVWIRLYFEIV